MVYELFEGGRNLSWREGGMGRTNMLPDFYVVGAQKCGTTALHSYLDAHPDIFLPSGKETKFFVDDTRFANGITYYLEHHFSDVNPGQLIGEVDPDYMYFEVALDRMFATMDLSRVKFLFLLREPVSRAFSHYLMSFRRGVEPLSFEDAIEAESERISKGYFERMHFSYMDRGYYFRQISRFIDRVDRDRICVILSEDLSRSPERVLDQILKFLNVESRLEEIYSWERQHVATVPRSTKLTQAVMAGGLHKTIARLLIPWPRQRKQLRQKILDWNQTKRIGITMDEGTRVRLRSAFSRENEKLARLIDRDLAHWE